MNVKAINLNWVREAEKGKIYRETARESSPLFVLKKPERSLLINYLVCFAKPHAWLVNEFYELS